MRSNCQFINFVKDKTVNGFLLNCESISKANADGLLNLGFFSRLVDSKDLVSRLRYVDSVGKGWGEWDRACNLLEEIAIGLRFFEEEISPESNPVRLLNYMYVFPSYFSNRSFLLIKCFSRLPFSSASISLSREKITVSILNAIKQFPCYIEGISPGLFLLLLLRATSLRYFTLTEESELIVKYLSISSKWQVREDDLLSIAAIEQRLTSLQRFLLDKESYDNGKNCPKKIAIFVCGQCRAFDLSLLGLKKTFSTINTGYDIYVSTWAEEGGLVADVAKLTRHISHETLRALMEKGMDATSIAEFITDYRVKSGGKISKDRLLSELLSDGCEVFVNIKSDREFPYNEMNNPEKMYYHNAFWIRTLGVDHFLNNYSHILKIRPDSSFSFDRLDLLPEPFVVTEEKEGWIFREWGFGIGDQLIFGDAISVVALLDAYRDGLISTRIVSDLFGRPPYQGHMNIGLKAWLDCINVCQNYVFKHCLIDLPKLNVGLFIKEGGSEEIGCGS